jgi:hypothetical protein
MHSLHSHSITYIWLYCTPCAFRLTYSSPKHVNLLNSCHIVVWYNCCNFGLQNSYRIIYSPDFLVVGTLWIWLSRIWKLDLTSFDIQFNVLSSCSRFWFISCSFLSTISPSAQCPHSPFYSFPHLNILQTQLNYQYRAHCLSSVCLLYQKHPDIHAAI